MTLQQTGSNASIYCDRCGEKLFVGRMWINDWWPMNPLWILGYRWKKFTPEMYQYEHKGKTVQLCLVCQAVREEEKEKAIRQKEAEERAAAYQAMRQRIDEWEASH